jgi:lipoprotein signal peptidase
MTIIPIILLSLLICLIAWLLARHERYNRWKTALLVLFCLVGGAVGNLALGYLDGLSVKYLYFSVLAVAAGAWFAYLLFKKLFRGPGQD